MPAVLRRKYGMTYYLQGLTMGLAYVAPIGVQNLFVINSALSQKRSRAVLTALIVIFFDVTLGLACFFGIGALMERFQWLQMAVLLAGSLVVLYIGFGLLRSKEVELSRTEENTSLGRTAASACIVTWFNPQAIIDGTMMLGAFRASFPPSKAFPFIAGVASASCLWFMGLTLVISIFRSHFRPSILRKLNIACGLVILFYGAKLFLHFVSMAIELK